MPVFWFPCSSVTYLSKQLENLTLSITWKILKAAPRAIVKVSKLGAAVPMQ